MLVINMGTIASVKITVSNDVATNSPACWMQKSTTVLHTKAAFSRFTVF